MNTGGPASEKTLLDWFAGQALAGLLACPVGSGRASENAASAYGLASAMLAEKARREAVVQESSTTDHSPDAGKMAEIQAANRELVGALECCLENLERWCPVKHREARTILAKHKGAA